MCFLEYAVEAEPTFENLMELPMNMAGYMSVERASDECEEQVISAVDITIEEANRRCEEAVRQNIYNIERQDDDVIEQVMEATRHTEEKKCEARIESRLKEAEILLEKKCQSYTDHAKQLVRNEVNAECEVIVAKRIRQAIINDRKESEEHCRRILEEEVEKQRKQDQVQCNIDSQVAIQHAVNMVVEAGQDALVSAVDQTEKRCVVKINEARLEAEAEANSVCSNQTEREVREAEDRVKKEWGKDLVNLRKLFQTKMKETRKRWVDEMLKVKKTSVKNNEVEAEELESESFLLLETGSGTEPQR